MANSLIKLDTENNIYTAPAGGDKYITVIANKTIAANLEEGAISQTSCACHSYGVEDVLLTPDAHQGSGVAVGTVVQTNGSLFPSWVGVDIGCGMRLILTDLTEKDIKNKEERQKLVDEISKHIPVGHSSHVSSRLESEAMIRILQGKDHLDNKEFIERCDLYTSRKPESDAIYKSQMQLGTLGGGNHFVELQIVEEIDDKIAALWGLSVGQLVIMIHSGSRKMGFDIANRYKRELLRFFEENKIPLVNKDSVWCLAKNAPKTALLDSQEDFLRKYGEAYFDEMNMAGNFAVSNRHMMQVAVEQAFKKRGYKTKNFRTLYDISHNIAAAEDGKIIIRKGATRAFPKGHPMLQNTCWYDTGHPIILPGSMDSSSYIMVGTQQSSKTHFSINHGAGRTMSRRKAKETVDRRIAKRAMSNIMHNHDNLTEIIDETGGAYKNISDITDSVVGAGIANVVAKVTPRAVIKG